MPALRKPCAKAGEYPPINLIYFHFHWFLSSPFFQQCKQYTYPTPMSRTSMCFLNAGMPFAAIDFFFPAKIIILISISAFQIILILQGEYVFPWIGKNIRGLGSGVGNACFCGNGNTVVIAVVVVPGVVGVVDDEVDLDYELLENSEHISRNDGLYPIMKNIIIVVCVIYVQYKNLYCIFVSTHSKTCLYIH